MTAPLPCLEASNMSVAINGHTIIHDCAFKLEAGEFVTIVGPNGAGKTSLLRAMAGLLPHMGRLEFGGVDIAAMQLSARARAISYLPQNGGAQWPMRVRDVVALGRLPFGAVLQRLSVADEKLVCQAMADCDITYLGDKPVTELSGGELSRVLLARVFASAAPVILVDEPTASLDPAHQIAIMQLLARAAASGRIVVAVSHDIGLAAQHAGRMIALAKGSIAADGRAGELLDSGVLESIFSVQFHRTSIEGRDVVSITPRI